LNKKEAILWTTAFNPNRKEIIRVYVGVVEIWAIEELAQEYFVTQGRVIRDAIKVALRHKEELYELLKMDTEI
jgi:hypothetical protein